MSKLYWPHVIYVLKLSLNLRREKMKQNITLSLDKDLIKKGKIIAAKKETSLNRLLSDFLKQIKGLEYLNSGQVIEGVLIENPFKA